MMMMMVMMKEVMRMRMAIMTIMIVIIMVAMSTIVTSCCRGYISRQAADSYSVLKLLQRESVVERLPVIQMEASPNSPTTLQI